MLKDVSNSNQEPETGESLYQKARALHDQGRNREAAEMYESAIRRADRVPLGWQNEYLEALGECRHEAIPTLKHIAAKKPRDGRDALHSGGASR